MSIRFSLVLLVYFLVSHFSQAAAVKDFLPVNHTYKSSIPTPESVFGFGIGERHVRYDQLLGYLHKLDDASDRIAITNVGQTYQYRNQVILTISSAKNIDRLDEILDERKPISSTKDDEPLVIWLGYSVHGDELSGANAAMVLAYHLAASEEKDVNQMLDNTIIVIEPSINPDGMDRFVNWVTDNKGAVANADPNHMEHHQGWRTGRTNHFGFDLNRDWLLLSQIETLNRMTYFHQYKPHVVGDFHEMVSNNSYFFQPGVPSRTNPLTPQNNISLTHLLAKYHAKSLDQQNTLYFSEENFDDFYYGKGSTYPDINGSVGVLFEQATSRGMQIETVNGVITLEFGIQNHVLTSLSTIEGAWQNKDKFIENRKTFYKNAEKLAKKEKFSGYLLSEVNDSYRLYELLKKLSHHQINVYQLKEDFRLDGKVFDKSTSYYIPLEQPQYTVIKAVFGTPTNFEDNTFYDVSGWTLPLAMNIDFHEVGRTWGLKLQDEAWKITPPVHIESDVNSYAYAFDWHHYLSPKLLNQLLSHNINVKVATEVFSSQVAGVNQEFDVGTILILAANQDSKDWQSTLLQAAQQNNIQLASISSGLTSKGVDLGSPSFSIINPVKALLIGGDGVSESEAGEIKFYINNVLNIPLSVIEKDRLNSIDLNAYTHIFMVDGNYHSLSANIELKLNYWLNNGGVLFTQKNAARWAAEKDILKTQFVSKSQITQLFDTSNLAYKDKSRLAARKRIAGAIFKTQLDLTHPLTYGFDKNELPVFRNNTLIMNAFDVPFVNVGLYTKNSLLSGYTDKNLVNRLANSASLAAHNVGKGRIIATTDNLAFRGYWLGTSKIIANTLFFGKAFSAKPIQ